MPYFLDGNNLLGGGGAGADGGDRDALVRELCDRLRRTRARAVLFFDGPAPAGGTSLGSLTLRFSGARSADDAIVEAISRAAAPGEIVLVTADRELGRRARDAGARLLEPARFWSRFGAGAAGAPRDETPAVNVEDWMRYFSDERNRGEG